MKRMVLSCLLLAACDGGNPEADGYVFSKGEYLNPDVNVVFVLHPSTDELLETAPPSARVKGASLEAYSLIRNGGADCEVHIVDPNASYKPEWIGHEMAHCLTGRWHA